jgi:hypothetical protein
MQRPVVSVLALVALSSAAAADPFYGLFDYNKPRLPESRDCAALAADIGPSQVWYGEFAGNRIDSFNYRSYHAFSARGCFASEYECRRWQNIAISYLRGGPVVATRCEQGGSSY